MEAVRSYRKRMYEYANTGCLDLWYATISERDIMRTLTGSAKQGAKKILGKARERTHIQVLSKLTDLVNKEHRLRINAPFIVRETHAQDGRRINEVLGLILESYMQSLADERKIMLRQYRIVDVVRKVVGVGSVGTRCWVIFLTGNHSNDPLFLQVKEAQPSVIEPYVNKSVYANQGQRVVIGQRLIQPAPDIFLGWCEVDNYQFYIRQLRDMKGGVEFDAKAVKIENLPQYTSLCGWALALAHAKSGDAAMIAGYAGKSETLDEAMVRFAFAYADQTETDHKALATAVKEGRIKASGVTE